MSALSMGISSAEEVDRADDAAEGRLVRWTQLSKPAAFSRAEFEKIAFRV